MICGGYVGSPGVPSNICYTYNGGKWATSSPTMINRVQGTGTMMSPYQYPTHKFFIMGGHLLIILTFHHF